LPISINRLLFSNNGRPDSIQGLARAGHGPALAGFYLRHFDNTPADTNDVCTLSDHGAALADTDVQRPDNDPAIPVKTPASSVRNGLPGSHNIAALAHGQASRPYPRPAHLQIRRCVSLQ
jgi:hypothetical protein